MMLAGWVALATMGRAAQAFADPTPLVTEPAGWHADPEQATALARRFAATAHVGDATAQTAAEAYVADRPGVALFVTRATATFPGQPAQAARVTRAALDELRGSSRRAALTGSTVEERDWQERVEADARQVTATLIWNDTTSHTVEIARVVVASDGKRIVAVTGECLASDTADPALVAACRASLATLDPGVASDRRVALALAPAATATATGEVPAPPPLPPRAPARLDDGSKITLPPIPVPVDRPRADRRPVLVGAGVIVLALLFWWNRRQRDLFEHEARRASPSRSPGPVPRATDDDASDLRAAARGEGPGTQPTEATKGANHRTSPPDTQGTQGAHDTPGTPDRQDP
jgi:hypothetical protein